MRTLPALLLLGALFTLGCSSDDRQRGRSDDTGSGGSGGGGGQGGQGGQATGGCESCGGETPICVDNEGCAAVCPDNRAACRVSEDDQAPPLCCPEGTQCCEAVAYGYSGGDLCRPAGEPCPIGCPGGESSCPLNEYCQTDPETGDYNCVQTCPQVAVCGFNLCCPEGSQCVNGECLLPDLTVDPGVLASSLQFSQVSAETDPCLINEACLAGPGERVVLRFSSRTQNIGVADFVIGDPNGNPNFMYDSCHMHFHYHQYAEYRLVDPSSNVVVTGKKQGFSIIDMGKVDPSDPNTPDSPKYNGGFQGIQRGWYDEYGAGLPCQWIDITGVPAGNYTLEVEVNPQRRIAEWSYANNVASIPVTIPDATCLTADCSSLDSDCTEGVCVDGQGCVAMPTNEGGACEDGQFCTTGEACQAGTCAGGGPLACAPPTGCYSAICDEANDTCVATPANDGQACDDGSPCTENTTCANGACTGGAPANEGMACDDGATCTSNTQCTAGVCGGGSGPVVYFAEDFSSNAQGWILGPEWEIGQAQASSGADIGGNDPANDHTPTLDDGVAGVVIGGFADKVNHGFYYLESPPFNTANAPSVVLGFHRWLNSDFIPYMTNSVDVWNGTTWVNLWTSSGSIVDAPAGGGPGWNYHQFNLTAYANPAMKVRFGFMVGSASGLYTIGSWNVDDVLVASLPCP